MKRIVYITFLIAVITGVNGCKKFLNVNPPSDLSGNNFWRTKSDVEQFTNGLYRLFRTAVFREDMTAPPGTGEFPFFAWSGDMRGAPIVANSEQVTRRDYVTYMATNNLKAALDPNYGYAQLFNSVRFTQWNLFFRVIASANIAVDRIDEVPDPNLTASDKARYKGEAVFLRNLCYFFMVRLYGDVPYYTEGFHQENLSRTPMVQVLKNCVADMGKYKEGLPWTYSDPAIVAVRAMRGSALALMMQMNMWLASFDDANATAYYTAVDKLGDELLNQNGGAYELLPLSSSHQIFEGRSKEGLFELPQNKNYGESFGWSAFADNTLYYPYKTISVKRDYLYYKTDFMQKLYPVGKPDNRITAWFDPLYLFDTHGLFLMKKFSNIFANQNTEDVNPDDNQPVFRLAGLILLQSEADADLGNFDKALTLVNMIRQRAGAAVFTSTGNDLIDDIFFERCRELMGEGQYWYDVVRTKRIIDNNYKFGYHCTVEQYKAGAWTWPIDPSALVNNPDMTLNNYWQ